MNAQTIKNKHGGESKNTFNGQGLMTSATIVEKNLELPTEKREPEL